MNCFSPLRSLPSSCIPNFYEPNKTVNCRYVCFCVIDVVQLTQNQTKIITFTFLKLHFLCGDYLKSSPLVYMVICPFLRCNCRILSSPLLCFFSLPGSSLILSQPARKKKSANRRKTKCSKKDSIPKKTVSQWSSFSNIPCSPHAYRYYSFISSAMKAKLAG